MIDKNNCHFINNMINKNNYNFTDNIDIDIHN